MTAQGNSMAVQAQYFVEQVLLIDDCETDNFIHTNFIKLAEFARRVIIKNTGEEAFNYLKALEKDVKDLPDVIFLDINMPKTNGFEFLRKFEGLSSQIKNKCKVVMLTSSDNPRDIQLVSENNIVKAYIYKPLTRTELETLKKSLGFYVKYESSSCD